LSAKFNQDDMPIQDIVSHEKSDGYEDINSLFNKRDKKIELAKKIKVATETMFSVDDIVEIINEILEEHKYTLEDIDEGLANHRLLPELGVTEAKIERIIAINQLIERAKREYNINLSQKFVKHLLCIKKNIFNQNYTIDDIYTALKDISEQRTNGKLQQIILGKISRCNIVGNSVVGKTAKNGEVVDMPEEKKEFPMAIRKEEKILLKIIAIITGVVIVVTTITIINTEHNKTKRAIKDIPSNLTMLLPDTPEELKEFDTGESIVEYYTTRGEVNGIPAITHNIPAIIDGIKEITSENMNNPELVDILLFEFYSEISSDKLHEFDNLLKELQEFYLEIDAKELYEKVNYRSSLGYMFNLGLIDKHDPYYETIKSLIVKYEEEMKRSDGNYSPFLGLNYEEQTILRRLPDKYRNNREDYENYAREIEKLAQKNKNRITVWSALGELGESYGKKNRS